MPMVNGLAKAAGERCLHLTAEQRCASFADPRRPAVCRDLKPMPEMCGTDREFALSYLARLESATAPAVSPGTVR